MKKLIALTATSLLILAGCATDSGEAEVPTTTTSTSTSTSSTTPEPAPEPEPVPEPVPEAAPAVAPAPASAPVYTPPTFSYCYLADGTAMMSDGTLTYMDSCHEFAGGPPRLADGTSIYDAFPENYEGVDWEADRAWSDCIEAGGTSETCAG